MQNNIVKVVIWGKEVGSLFWDERRKRSVFSYHSDFIKGGLDIAPLSASIQNPRNKLQWQAHRHQEGRYGRLGTFRQD